jgi:lysophospholipid acyltransferase (LPLAT)-like uncharacterized protein
VILRVPRRLLRHPAFVAVASSALAWVLKLLRLTWRVRYEGIDPFARDEPFVAAVWHRNLIIAAPIFHSRHVLVPVSRSHDGDLTVAVLEKLGFDPPPRGSSSRGAAAVLRRIIRFLEQGRLVAVLADGPRGPARRVKSGVLGAARASGRRLLPVGMSAHPCLRFGSWDRALLPLPFAKVVVAYGEPFRVPKSTHKGDLEALRQHLEDQLESLTDDLDARLRLPP